MYRERAREEGGWQRWTGIAVIALVLQLPLFGAFLVQTTSREHTAVRKRPSPLVGRVLPQTRKDEPEEQDELPKDAKVVEVLQDEPDEIKPVKAKLVADKTVRTEKEVRSLKVDRPDKRPGRARVKKRSKIQSKDSDSPDPTRLNQPEEKLAMLQPKDKLPEADRGRQVQPTVMDLGSESRLLLPSTSAKAEIANLQTLNGSMSTDDHLPDLERDRSTLLNANKYKYADFFYRVKEAVRRHWHPNSVYRRRDPTGKVYGVKDRHTVLRVTLDQRGRLLKLTTRKHSGLGFMDDEARASFRRAQPFPNPPKGLVRNGVISFDFGFYFEITSGRYRFKWRRL